jgi:predicted transcriptional regulator
MATRNISVPDPLMEKIVEAAEEKTDTGNVSQYLRRLAAQDINGERNRLGEEEIRSMLEELLQSVENQLERIEEVEQRIDRLEMNSTDSDTNVDVDHAMDQTYRILQENENPLTIPDVHARMDEDLPVHHVKTAVERLADQHLLERIDTEDTANVRWTTK